MSDGTKAGRASGVSRRGLLGLAAAGGVGALAAATGGGAATAASVPGPVRLTAPGPGVGATPSADPGLSPFPQEDDLNFETLFAYGEAAYQAGEVGEVGATVAAVQAAITAGGAGALPAYQPYFDSFMALAQRVRKNADDELAAGHTVSARSRYLRAASYFNCALFFVLGTSTPGREGEVYGAMQACWNAAAGLLDPVFERVEIPATVRFLDPAGSSTPVTRTVSLPAYWVRAAGGGTHPTVIVGNGSDAQFIDVYAFGAAAAVQRGYNVLVFEGPGQGSMLFQQNVPFTPYWGDVVSPVVDFVLAQSETDPARVALTGWSLGALLVLRAAAAEHRLAAVVSDPAYVRNSALWSSLVEAIEHNVGPVTNENWMTLYNALPPVGSATESQLALKFLVNKRGGIWGSSFHDTAASGQVIEDIVSLLATVGEYDADAALIGQITAHVLLTRYEGDQFIPDELGELYDALTGAASRTIHHFTAAEGAMFHTGPMAPQVRNEFVFDWLDGVLGNGSGPAPSGGGTSGSGTPQVLAPTGSDPAAVAAVGAGLLGAGAALGIAHRRRRGRDDTRDA